MGSKLKVLAIDTSCKTAQVGITDGGIVMAEIAINNLKTHSVKLMPSINSCLESIDHTLNDIDLIAVANGPGSYTGLRIGVVTAKALAYAGGIPVVGVNSLDALAYGVNETEEKIVCSLIDGRSSRCFYAIYKNGKLYNEYSLGMAGDICQYLLNEFPEEKIIFCGDGLVSNMDLIKGIMKDRFAKVPDCMLLGRASFIAGAGEKIYINSSNKETDFTHSQLKVNYMRPSQAERQRYEI